MTVNSHVVVWNIDEAAQARQQVVLTEHTRAINSVCWQGKDSQLFASGGGDASINVYDMRGRAITTLSTESRDAINDIEFSPVNTNILAVARHSGHVQIWDIRKTSSALKVLYGHTMPVFCVAWHWHTALKDIVASGSRDCRYARISTSLARRSCAEA